MTRQTPSAKAGADYVLPAHAIRRRIESLEGRFADILYPATTDKLTPTHHELSGELNGLYHTLGERRPLFTPAYLFDHLRKKYTAEQHGDTP